MPSAFVPRVLCLVVLCALLSTNGRAQVTTPKPLPPRQVWLAKGNKALVKFRALYPQLNVGMVASFMSIPKIGALFGRDKADWKELSSDSQLPFNADGNLFEYRSVFRRLNGSDAEAAKYFPIGLDTVRVLIDDGENKYVANITFSVQNGKPRVATRSFRMPTPDSNSSMGFSRNFTILLQDRDAEFVWPHVYEIREVTLVEPPNPAVCELRFLSGGNAITANGTVLATNVYPLSFQMTMTLLTSTSTATNPCSIVIRVRDSSDALSDPTRLRFESITVRPPYAVNTTTRFVVGVDKKASIELIGYSANTISGQESLVSFTVKELPPFGVLYDTSDPELGVNAVKVVAGRIIYTGNKTRVVLTYVPPEDILQLMTKGKIKDFQLQYVVNSARTNLWGAGYVTVHFTKPQAPSCDAKSYFPVFWDQPVRYVQVPYTDVDGRVERVILVSTPAKPMGDLVSVKRNASNVVDTVVLKAGDVIDDKLRSLQYVVRPANRGQVGTDFFTFRAVTDSQMACHGNLTFFVINHDQNRDPDTGDEVRFEIAPDNALTVFPLWGKANRSVLGSVDRGSNVGVVIDAVDSRATFYKFDASRAPYDPGLTYRGQLGRDAYCRRYDCTAFKDAQLRAGDTVDFTSLWEEDAIEQSENRAWFLVQTPTLASMDDTGTKAQTPNASCLRISYHYAIRDDLGKTLNTTARQQLCIYLRPSRKRQITCWYKVPSKRNTELNRQTENEVPCRISDIPGSRVLVLDPDSARRHGKAPTYRLYNAELDGFRVKRAARLDAISLYGTLGTWLTNEQNYVVAVLSSKTRSQQMTFRARIFSAPDSDPNAFEDVRVLIQRNNTLPTWASPEPASGEFAPINPTLFPVSMGKQAVFQLQAFDDEDDLLSFRILRAPKLGILRNEVEYMKNRTLSRPLVRGSRITIPRGSSFRNAMLLYYDAVLRNDVALPSNDSITFVADDGGGIVSIPLTITFRVEAAADSGTNNLPSPLVAVVVVAALVVLLVAVTVVLVRRRGRDRYLHLPKNGGTEMN